MAGIVHDSQDTAVAAVHEALEEATKDAKWLTAIWTVVGNTLYLRHWTTFDFPVAEISSACRLLRINFLENQQQEDEPPPPLPAADFIKMAMDETRKEMPEEEDEEREENIDE